MEFIDTGGGIVEPWWVVLWCRIAHRRSVLAETDEGVIVRYCPRCTLVLRVEASGSSPEDA